MILIYPALVSNTIPIEILPAVTKMLEDYIITYSLADIMNKSRNKNMADAKKDLRSGEQKFAAMLREEVTELELKRLDEDLLYNDLKFLTEDSFDDFLKTPPSKGGLGLGNMKPSAFEDIKKKILSMSKPLNDDESKPLNDDDFRNKIDAVTLDVKRYEKLTQDQKLRNTFAQTQTQLEALLQRKKEYDEGKSKREAEEAFLKAQLDDSKFKARHQFDDKLAEIKKRRDDAISNQTSILKNLNDIKNNNKKADIEDKKYKLEVQKLENDKKKYDDEIDKRNNELKIQQQKISAAEYEERHRVTDKLAEIQKRKQDYEKNKIALIKDKNAIIQNYVNFKQDLRKKRRENARVDVSSIQLSTEMALLPTTQKVDTAEGPMMVGVKVVPFQVKTDSTLAELLMSDKHMSALQAKSQGFLRKMTRKLWNAFYILTRRIPFVKKRPGTITGDPMKDIIYGQTSHRNRVFAIIDINEITDSAFFDDAGGVKKLFGLGWNNLVFIDDVGKKGIFCMKKFKGLCSQISFPTMFSSLGGRDNLYKDLENSRATTSPFFRTKKSKKSLFGEGARLASKRLIEYQSLNEQEMLQEDISSFSSVINKINIISIIKQFKTNAKSGEDVKEVKKILDKNKIKPIPPENLLKIGNKYHKDFGKTYSFAFKVVKNSLSGSDKKKKALSIYFTCLGLIKSTKNNTDSIVETKNVLKEMVPKLRAKDDGDDSNMKYYTRILITAIISGIILLKPTLIFISLFFLAVFAIKTGIFNDDDNDDAGGY